MRSSIALALVIALAGRAAAQEAPLPPPPPDPADPTPPPTPDPTPDPTPTPTPMPPPTPSVDPTPAPDPDPDPLSEVEKPAAEPTEDSGPKVIKEVVKDHGLVFGFEIGYGSAGGTSSQVYGGGRGTGLVIGYRYQRVTVEWHLLHTYALVAKESALRGDTTQGELSASTVLARVKLLDVPMVEVVAGPAMLSVPMLRITEDDLGEQLVNTTDLRGIGLMIGGSVGYKVSDNVAFALDVRAAVITRWELPGANYVVPGDRTADGGVMYTEATEDASARPWTATLLMRVLL